MQGARVWSLVLDDSMYGGAAKLVHHNYWNLRILEPALHNKRNHHNEKPVCCN